MIKRLKREEKINPLVFANIGDLFFQRFGNNKTHINTNTQTIRIAHPDGGVYEITIKKVV